MSRKFVLSPEVPGGFGSGVVGNFEVWPPQIQQLHIAFDGWFGDQFLDSYPCYFVTERLAEEFGVRGFTGFQLKEMKSTRSPIFRELQPIDVLPKFLWLQVDGSPGDDFFLLPNNANLIVSERVLEVILKTHPVLLEYEEMDSV